MFRKFCRLAAARGRAVLLMGLGLTATGAGAGELTVGDVAQLRAAMTAAVAGDIIVLKPGVYRLGDKLRTRNPGRAQAPITVRATRFGTVTLEVATQTGFFVTAPHWHFEALFLRGVCPTHDGCEHAFHVVGAADHTVIRGNRAEDFNAQIKSNGIEIAGRREFPDDVLVEANLFRNTSVRDTARPVTPVDVVGGKRWIIRDNFIADFSKGKGNKVSYAAFLKGNSSDGVIERNLVVCELEHKGGDRIGLSLGGGGTGAKYCEGGACPQEHSNGVIRNNIVMNCPSEPGIYLNNAAATKVVHNTLFNTRGILGRFAATSADIRNNVLSGAVRLRRGATATRSANVIGLNSQFRNWFAFAEEGDFSLLPGSELVNSGEQVDAVHDDYCGVARSDGRPDRGAVELSFDPFCGKFDALDMPGFSR